MRKQFFELLFAAMAKDDKIIFLTGDLGFGLADQIKEAYPERYYNVGAAEQVLITAGVGLALCGKIPVCYSITPFLIDRPFEAIKLYMNYEQIPVKLVGSGRGEDYAHDGQSHFEHNTMDVFPNIIHLRPELHELQRSVETLLYNDKPTFLSLCR